MKDATVWGAVPITSNRPTEQYDVITYDKKARHLSAAGELTGQGQLIPLAGI